VTRLGASKDFEPSASAVSPVGPVEAALGTGLPQAARPSGGRQTASTLRYAGFEQVGSIRSYLFNRIVTGEKTTQVVMAAEIPLFMKHHLHIQDGPALCLHVLSEIDRQETEHTTTANRALTDEDIVAYLATRPAPPQPKGRREKPLPA
jgi:hypothetical protein